MLKVGELGRMAILLSFQYELIPVVDVGIVETGIEEELGSPCARLPALASAWLRASVALPQVYCFQNHRDDIHLATTSKLRRNPKW